MNRFFKFDESQHPRAPAGSEDGGQFVSGGGEGSGGGASEKAVQLTASGHRPLSTIAREISRNWAGKVNFGAKPYLDAMRSLDDIKDNYYEDSGRSVVAYFLSNASTWRGETAKEIKAELKAILKR
jgi:hypothetical protein